MFNILTKFHPPPPLKKYSIFRTFKLNFINYVLNLELFLMSLEALYRKCVFIYMYIEMIISKYA